ncbi:putative Translin-1 [Phyllosticta capitalensis]|uniref:putative Translin-1 n=1 Tax=Phyllosticta capitalensis TaxID=121624 RepID=UPI0031307158
MESNAKSSIPERLAHSCSGEQRLPTSPADANSAASATTQHQPQISTIMAAERPSVVDPVIFEQLQERIDQDGAVREELRDIIQSLEKHGRSAQSILSRAHSTPTSQLPAVITAAEAAIRDEVAAVQKLAEAASKLPYYKFNGIWSRQVQDTVFTILYGGYLGGYAPDGGVAKPGRLLSIEEVGAIMNVPVNLKDKDDFHVTIEEYLQALISLIDELARLARNSVTLGDYNRPIQIAQFIKDVHAGFQILNLKNDSLRRRSDGIKYRVKEVEDVVYDLSLRNLIPAESA